jgi:hypothetical protein
VRGRPGHGLAGGRGDQPRCRRCAPRRPVSTEPAPDARARACAPTDTLLVSAAHPGAHPRTRTAGAGDLRVRRVTRAVRAGWVCCARRIRDTRQVRRLPRPRRHGRCPRERGVRRPAHTDLRGHGRCAQERGVRRPSGADPRRHGRCLPDGARPFDARRCLVVGGDEETGLIGAGEVVEQLGQGVVEHRDRQERRVGEGQRHSGRDDRRAMPHRRPDVGLDPGRDRVRRRRRRHRAAERDSAAGPRGAGRHRGRRRRRRASARRRPLVRRPPPHRRSTTSRPCPAR